MTIIQQNRTHAVMSQRTESATSLDDFPTPPWATRALMHYILRGEGQNQSCLEPACGRGHMAQPLMEYFSKVEPRDIYPYGYGEVSNFTSEKYRLNQFDWVITNPPFRLAEEFIDKSLDIARVGVAMLTRTVFIESIGRYNRLFSLRPPTHVAQFVERVPMVKGRLDRRASTATGYCWLVWRKEQVKAQTDLLWIPPCRKQLERDEDY